MNKMLQVRFDAVPIGESFYDPSGEWCIRTKTHEARDSWCAPGFCITFDADLLVGVTEHVFAKCN